MRNLQLLFLALGALIFTSSCNIEHTVNLNKDMTGTNSVAIDINEMLNTLRSFMPDSADKSNRSLLENRNINIDIDTVKQQFNKIKGISNFKFNDNLDNGLVDFSYDFKDQQYFEKGIAILIKDQSEDTIAEGDFFILNEDSLVIDFTSPTFQAALGNNDGIEDLNAFDLGEYQFTLNFPFPIKTVSNDLFSLSQDKQTLSLKVPIKQLVLDAEKLNVQLTW